MAGTRADRSIDVRSAARLGLGESRFRLIAARGGKLAIAACACMALAACAQDGSRTAAAPSTPSVQPIALSQDGVPQLAGAVMVAGFAPVVDPSARAFAPAARPSASAGPAAKPASSGLASWYGDRFHGRTTANGERFDMGAFTAAHRSFPLPSYVRVTNVFNGRSIVVRVNDRGPYHGDRVIDVSRRTADVLGFKGHGVGTVKLDYVGKAPAQSDDRRLLASYQEFGRPSVAQGVQMAALAPVSDSDLAAEAGSGGAYALASAAVATSVAAVSNSASSVASAARTAASTASAAVGSVLPPARRDAEPVAVAAAAAYRAPTGVDPYALSAYAPPQPLIAAPAAITEPKAARKRVVAPAEPTLASATPELRGVGAPRPAPAASAPADVSSRIASSFESFGGMSVQSGGSVTADALR